MDESDRPARPVPKIRNKKLGYFLGALVSTVAAILWVIVILAYLQGLLVRCFMSLGCSESGIPTPLLLALAGYLLLVIVLAALARRLFNSRFGPALLLNVAPLLTFIALYLLFIQYESYSQRSDRISAARTAISDAPVIHLGEPFVKKVNNPHGGIIMFLHVPFTVSRTVQARSLGFLANLENSASVKFSSKPQCDDAYVEPSYGFHVVDREYIERPLPPEFSGTVIVSPQLEPNKQYYLLQEKHFSYEPCRVSDYQEFDPKQLRITLTTSEAERVLNEGDE